MSARRKLEERIRRKEQEIKELEMKIREGRAYVQALQEAVKILPRSAPDDREGQILRPGSLMARARELILEQGTPLHISQILRGVGKPVDKANRASLGGSLAAYVRRGEIFTRPAPNTFGLREMSEGEFVPEPPPGFGKKAGDDDEVHF